MNYLLKSPKRKSRSILRKRKSPKRKSRSILHKRKSPKRKSILHKRKSPKRKSPKRKSILRKRKSPKRKSILRKRKSRSRVPKRKSRSVRRKSHMLKGGSKENGVCEKCFKQLHDDDGVEYNGKWIHKKEHAVQCNIDQEAYHEQRILKKEAEKEAAKKAKTDKKKAAHEAKQQAQAYTNTPEGAAEIRQKELEKRKVDLASEHETMLELMKDNPDQWLKKKNIKIEKRMRKQIEMEREHIRFEGLTAEQKHAELAADFFKVPDGKNEFEKIIIEAEKIRRNNYKKFEVSQTTKMMTLIYQIYTSQRKTLISYSKDSINRINPSKPNEFSIEIHCTTFRPGHNPNYPSEHFYGHVTLLIYREDVHNPEKYHYGVYVNDKTDIVDDFTRRFWTDENPVIPPPMVPLNTNTNTEIKILFPNKNAADLMVEYYNWCIKTCPKKKPDKALPWRGTYKTLTLWGD